MKKTMCLLLVCLLIGCGGGGGGGSDSGSGDTWWAGTYSGPLALQENTCPTSAPVYAAPRLVINQSNTDILVNYSEPGGFAATMTGYEFGGGLHATTTRPSGNCTIENFIDVTNLADQSATVQVEMEITCGSLQCHATWKSTATREG